MPRTASRAAYLLPTTAATAVAAVMLTLSGLLAGVLMQSSSASPLRWTGVVMLGVSASLLLGWVVLNYRNTKIQSANALLRLERFTRAFQLSQGMIRSVDGRIDVWTHGAERLYGFAAENARNRVSHELLQTRFPVPLASINEQLMKEGVWQGELTHHHQNGDAVHVMSHWALHKGQAGEADAVLEMNVDLTPLKQSRRDRDQASALLRTIVDTAPGLIYAKDRQGRLLLANQSTLELLGKRREEVEGRTDLELLADTTQAQLVMLNDRRIMQARHAEEVEEVVGLTDGQPRVWFSSKAPLCDGDGAVIGLVGISVEITDRKRLEQRLRLLIDELTHRVKNTLATVQAIAMQTLRGADPAIYAALEGRLKALAAAHDILTEHIWEGAEIHAVLVAQLMPFGMKPGDRADLAGPRLRLSSKAAVALGLAVHELASNAARYGALSSPTGRIRIQWSVSRDAEPSFSLRWTELGGPAVSRPTKRGFGTRLLERSVAADLGGVVRIEFDDPQGVIIHIDAPLGAVMAPAIIMPFPRVSAGPGVVG